MRMGMKLLTLLCLLLLRIGGSECRGKKHSRGADFLNVENYGAKGDDFLDVKNNNEKNGDFFNVMNYGAKGDGRTDDSKALMDTWKAACGFKGSVRYYIPPGNYIVGPLNFNGPCKGVTTMNFMIKGTLKASTDLSKYGPTDSWVMFGWLTGLKLTGYGTFDGQGAASWPLNNCPKNKNCKVLPASIKFVATDYTEVQAITSLNSKFFHIVLLDCKNFKATNLQITAPATSPNTDGIHIERSTDVSISNSKIGTGDDCISIGHGNTRVSINGVTCGPGHGISVGSLGRYPNEGDVMGLSVTGCVLTGTANGLRIKTWQDSPDTSVATNMTFENIVMYNVANPIIIDQNYCPYTYCTARAPSRVKISDVSFKNIRGTSATETAVTLHCSNGLPCQNVRLQDVQLNYYGPGKRAKATCMNVKASYSGTQIPPPC
ncbi:hypothetical protein AMTRI_Chr13g91800 [Amborella trichopoda]